jgi:two-component system, cell cycle sensor histidine kinase and response regulator CckA
MNKPSSEEDNWEQRREQIIGLGEHSARKSYYPELQHRIQELESTKSALAVTNRHLQAVLNAASEFSIIATDRDGLITIFNRGSEKMLGYTADEMVGKQTPLILHLSSEVETRGRELSSELGREVAGFMVFVEHACDVGAEQHEWTYLRKDGCRILVSLTVTPMRDELGNVAGFLGIAEDITKQRLAEEEKEKMAQSLLHAQKIDSIGRLAGGIAHDFNNLLTPILGYGELLRASCVDDERSIRKIDAILTAASKAGDLTRQLLAFGRKQVMEMKTIDLNQTIKAFSIMLERTIRENISISMRLDADPANILADKSQIEQIIMNLAVNAQDAMPDGGTLLIETSSLTLQQAAIGQPDLQPGRYVLFTVSDTGIGMDEETRNRIFEPFFTTKQLGKGTGLGLSTVFGIVKQHGGSISIYSEPDNGSTFRIYFPSVEESPDDAVASSDNTIRKTVCSNATILLVEDNQMVRELTSELLTESGYVVLSSDDPQQGLEMLRAHGGHVDLLLSDVIMPQKNGPMLYEELKYIQSDLKVLYMSGYSENFILSNEIPGIHTNYIQKPFTARSLLDKVEAIICRKNLREPDL